MKKGILILSMISTCILCACKAIEPKESNVAQSNFESTKKTIEEGLEEIDWSSEHLECEITDTFSIAADIVSDSVYQNPFGLYHYTEVDGEISQAEKAVADEELANLINQYFGGDVTITWTESEEKGLDYATVLMVGDKKSWSYLPENVDVSYRQMQVLDVFFPIRTTHYQKELVEAKIKEVSEVFSDYIKFDNCTYECVVFDEKLRENIKAFGEEHRIDDYGVIDDTIENCYGIRVNQVLDNGVPFRRIYSEGDLLYNELRIQLDSDYQVVLFGADNNVVVDDTPFKTIDIVPLKTIIKTFSDKYCKGLKTIITDVKLNYGIWGKVQDENGQLYVAPYWVLTFYQEGRDSMWQCVYSAMNGELLCSVL